MEKLIEILSYRRQHGSAGEQEFIDAYITPLKPRSMCNSKGEILAYVVDNTRGQTDSKVMWSSHIDTMHRNGANSRQEVWVDVDGTAFVEASCDCLGADDGAGMWLMLEMIKRDVAGVYVFHAGEEIGCWGSRGLATEHSEWLAQFTHAIAFDRRGTTSIITHQRGERACSDVLGNTLIELFNMEHMLDNTGVYTDTAEYMEIIPECVNISIGYNHEHSSQETLDTTYVLALRDAICALDWDKITLPVVRDPNVSESLYDKYNKYDDYSYTTARIHNYVPDYSTAYIPDVGELMDMTTVDLGDWVLDTDPLEVAYLLKDMAEQLTVLQYGGYDGYTKN